MIQIQEDLLEMTKMRAFLADDLLEAYIDYSSLYSLSAWMLFLEERLRRIELEISIM